MTWYKEYVHTSIDCSGVCIFCLEYVTRGNTCQGCEYTSCISIVCKKCQIDGLIDIIPSNETWFCSPICSQYYKGYSSSQCLCYTQLEIYNNIAIKNIYEQVKSFYPNVIADIIAQYSLN